MRISSVTLLLVMLWALSVQSQPPSPTPSKTGQEQQQTSSNVSPDARTNQTIPEPSIPTTVVSVAKQEQPVPTNQSAQSHTEPSEDWRIVLFTFVLTIVAIVQGILMWRQSVYMRNGLAHTKTAAEAAKISASVAQQALQISQRAWLSLHIVQLSGEPLGPPTLRLQMFNNGHLPASITERSATCLVNEPFPDAISREMAWRKHPMPIAPGQWIWVVAELPGLALTQENWKEIVNGELPLLVYGAVRYDTGFADLPGETGFGFRYDHTGTLRPEHERFSIPETAAGHNYMK